MCHPHPHKLREDVDQAQTELRHPVPRVTADLIQEMQSVGIRHLPLPEMMIAVATGAGI